jgi:Protein of unknown function (DUF3253)
MSDAIRAEILRQCAARAPNRSICPSEVARALWPTEWREHMDKVRCVGTQLARASEIQITQRGSVRDPHEEIRGAIRYQLPKTEDL